MVAVKQNRLYLYTYKTERGARKNENERDESEYKDNKWDVNIMKIELSHKEKWSKNIKKGSQLSTAEDGAYFCV